MCNKRFYCGNNYLRHKATTTHRMLCKSKSKRRRVTTKKNKENFEKNNIFQGVAVGAEFGVTGLHPHTHAVVVARQGIAYNTVKAILKKMVNKSCDNCQGAKNIKTAVRYSTKEDRKSYITGIDKGYGSVLYKAHQYAKQYTKMEIRIQLLQPLRQSTERSLNLPFRTN